MLDVVALAEKVYSQLGPGFSERVYHNAMEVLLRKDGIQYESERIVPIPFEGHVNNESILEFKAIKTLNDQADLQAQNYLILTGLKKAYLVNFPPFPNRQVEVRCVALGSLEETV
jgi:GxxExxY protein